MKSVIVTGHLYGRGGGAWAVICIARALQKHGDVAVFTMTDIPASVMEILPQGVSVAQYVPGCSLGADLLFNIDHFAYEKPLAKRNLAHIFHPHEHNTAVPEEYELVGNSEYTSGQARGLWNRECQTLYIIVEPMPMGRKAQEILHVSRFSRPQPLADKGHRQMLAAFMQMCNDGLQGWTLNMVGSVDPGQMGYFNQLMGVAQGHSVRFYPNLEQDHLAQLYSRAAIYWHLTGVTLPDIPGAQEHLGLTTIEAMSAGAVPITLGTGGQPEIVEHGVTGFLVANEVDLQHHTERLIENLSLWGLMSQEAHVAAQAWVAWDCFQDRVDAVLNRAPIPALPTAQRPAADFTSQDVAIIVPVYNNSDMTRRMLDGMLQRTVEGWGEFIVMDNASEDDTAEVLARYADQGVIHIRNDRNLGYLGGILSGLEHTKKPLVLAMNNDVLPIEDGWLVRMVETMRPDVGIVGAKLVYTNGNLQHAGVLIDWNRPDIAFHRYYGWPDHPGANQAQPMPAVTGACMLARRELIERVPLSYLLGHNYEDIDICLNAWTRGWSVIYQPAARLLHLEAVTKKERLARELLGEIAHNRQVFTERWFPWERHPEVGEIVRTNAQMLRET